MSITSLTSGISPITPVSVRSFLAFVVLVAAYTWAFAAAFWLPIAPPWNFLLETHPGRVWAGVGAVVVAGTILPFGLYLAGLARISAAHANLTSTLEPVVATLTAFLILGETLAGRQLFGGVLILAGIGLIHGRVA